MPYNADKVYNKQGTWTNWNDFLGNEIPTFEEAKRIIKEFGPEGGFLGVEQYQEAKAWRSKYNLPRIASATYTLQGTWTNWLDFLGNDYPLFEEAKKIIKEFGPKEGFSTGDAYRVAKAWRDKYNLPHDPDKVYTRQGTWTNWKNFLGNETPTFEEAKKIIQEYGPEGGFSGKRQYQKAKVWRDKYNLPSAPARVYGEQGTWTNWGDFLSNKIPTFEKAKKIIKEFGPEEGFSSVSRYKKAKTWRDKYNLPRFADQAYTSQGTWTNWGDFLGKTNLPQPYYFLGNERPSFEKAKEIIQKFGPKEGFSGLKQYKEAKDWRDKYNLPSSPDFVYTKQGTWTNWYDFLGNEWPTFEEAKKIIKEYGPEEGFLGTKQYQNAKAWRSKYNLPSNPDHTYTRQGTWTNWLDFLGKHKLPQRYRRNLDLPAYEEEALL